MLKKVVEVVGTFVWYLILEEKLSVFTTKMLAIGFYYIAFVMLRYIPSIICSEYLL
jgi:hypothetical protein